MPAIEIQRLNKHILELQDLVDSPALFLDKFHEILVLYNRWSLRKDNQSIPRTLLKTYQVPRQVLQLVETELLPQAANKPESILSLVDFLWQDDYLESRQLVASLLGNLPADYCESVKQRLEQWIVPGLDLAVLDALLIKATKTIRQHLPEYWEATIFEMLESFKPAHQNTGLHAMLEVIRDDKYSRVPSLFKLIRPFLQASNENLQLGITNVLAALARRVPSETLHFLKEILSTTPGSEIERTVRRVSTHFPPAQRDILLTAIKQHSVTVIQFELK